MDRAYSLKEQTMHKYQYIVLLAVIILPAFVCSAQETEWDINSAYVKKSTWFDTIVASREKFRTESGEAHLKEIEAKGIAFKYKVAGPFTPDANSGFDVASDKETGELKVGGQAVKWRDENSIKFNKVIDMAKIANLKAGECAFYRIEISYTGEESINQFAIIQATRSGVLQHAEQLKRVTLRNDPRRPYSCAIPFDRTAHVYMQKKRNRMYLLGAVMADESGKCEMLLLSHTGGNFDGPAMVDKQAELHEKVMFDFSDAQSRAEMDLEFQEGLWSPDVHHHSKRRAPKDWIPGNSEVFLKSRYNEALKKMYSQAQQLLNGDRLEKAGPITAEDSKLYIAFIKRFDDEFKKSPTTSFAELRRRFYLLRIADDVAHIKRKLSNMELAVKDQIEMFGREYPNGKKNLARIEKLKKSAAEMVPVFFKSDGGPDMFKKAAAVIGAASLAETDILLQNPALGDKLLMIKGDLRITQSWNGADKYGSEIVTMSPVGPKGKFTTLHKSTGPHYGKTAPLALNNIELDWDAEKILVCDNREIYEINADGSGEPKDLLKPEHGAVHDACRLPDGRLIYSATSVEQAVPCTGYAGVANLHIANADGTGVRRLCYDQDYNWHPTVMENGRVMFLRWEYTSSVHYFSRIVMTMNPDGTDQVAHYGSNSYWPNSTFWPRQLPGISSKFLGIVSGHHGVHKEGEFHLFDVSKGRFEADGAYHKIGARSQKVVPLIKDKLVDGVFPRFVTPFPLGTGTKDGSGKYFLATGRNSKDGDWGLYLVDVFDNMTLIKRGNISHARPLAKRKKPTIIPDRVDLTKKTSNVVISDIYYGPGLKGIERGAVKSLRIGSPVYRYPGNGDTYASAAEGGWDVKMILGTVPVEDDGSVSFVSPVNMPLFVQPLNADGQALQLMRSWFVPMPGAPVSCVGCHESQNDAPPPRTSKAMRRGPSEIKAWNGPMRGFSFRREIQPLLDRKCVGCHDGSKKKETRSGSPMPDFKSIEPKKNMFSVSYLNLQRYVRRAGVEADHHLFRPTEFMPDTSHLMKMLKKGHYNVKLTATEWERLYTWIDFNVPFAGSWTESVRKPNNNQVATRAKYQKLYANIDDTTEAQTPEPERPEFQKPSPEQKRKKTPEVKGWPIDEITAKELQKNCGLEPLELELGDSVKMNLVPIPAGSYPMGDGGTYYDEPPKAVKISKPFYIGTTEVTFAQYAQFDKEHENGFIEGRGKDRFTRGVFDMSQTNLPVVRVTQTRAKEFCEWLSKKTGRKVSLPTEEQWEWAARAGSGGSNYLNATNAVKGYNIVDEKTNTDGRFFGKGGWNYGRIQKGHSDGQPWVNEAESMLPNAWGLYNVLGNVSEWTDSDYVPIKEIGIATDADDTIKYKAVRGGSWNDTASFATLSSRWRYTNYQPVYDVGFRVIVTN